MIKIGFELEVDEGALMPSTREITEAIRQGLPKEYWADHREETWGISTIFPLGSDGRPLLYQTPEPPSYELVKAQLAEQRKLVGVLDRNLLADEERIANLERCNGNQSDTINTYQQQLKAMEVRLNDALLEWKRAKKDRDTARRIIVVKEGMIEGYQRLCRQKNARIKELRNRWGNDDQLVKLEDIKGELGAACADLEVALDAIRTER